MTIPSTLMVASEDNRRWQKLLLYAFLLSVTLAIYSATLWFAIQSDDYRYIQLNPLIRRFSPGYLKAIWSYSYLGHYAPLCLTFLAALYHFFGLSPFGYHVAQI